MAQWTAGAAAEQIMPCCKTDTPPAIDGDLSDSAWVKGEPVTSFFQYNSNDPAPFETMAVMLYDDQKLYLGVLMRKNPGEKLSDGSMWSGDAVELFLDPGRTMTHYFQVAANHKEKFMAACELGKSGNPEWKGGLEAAARQVPGGWTLEMSVPFAPLGVTPKPGDAWGANLCRDDSAHGLSTFACLRGGFHQPSAFAILRFMEKAASSGKLAEEAARAAATAEKRYAELIGELRQAAAALGAGTPAAELVNKKLAECETLAGTLSKTEAGKGLLVAKQKSWLLTSLADDLADNLAWRIKTAQLFNKE